MPIVHQFDYAKPRTLEEVFNLFARHKNYALLAGGTDLVNMLKENVAKPDVVIDLKGLELLNTISFENGALIIGAGVTFSDLIESKIVQDKFPVIVEIAKTVASIGVRNRATVVGNICSSVPCMDSGPLMLAYDANVIVEGPGGGRIIPAEKWFIAPRKNSLQRGELITGVSLPLPRHKHAGCWVKLGRYDGEDLVQVSLLLLALMDGTFRISFGAVAPVPVRAKKIEQLLNGQNLEPAIIKKATMLIEQEIKPITDVRASKEYRMHMAKVMFTRGLQAALSRLNGGGPEYGTRLL